MCNVCDRVCVRCAYLAPRCCCVRSVAVVCLKVVVFREMEINDHHKLLFSIIRLVCVCVYVCECVARELRGVFETDANELVRYVDKAAKRERERERRCLRRSIPALLRHASSGFTFTQHAIDLSGLRLRFSFVQFCVQLLTVFSSRVQSVRVVRRQT